MSGAISCPFFNAAFDILQLQSIDELIKRRHSIAQRYNEKLKGIQGIVCPPHNEHSIGNSSYFPIMIDNQYGSSRDLLHEYLLMNNIYSRRYFFPLISDFPMYRGYASAQHNNLPNAKLVSNQILCLPIYPDLMDDDIDFISTLIRNFKR